jgi:hypothetical protein
VGRVAAPEDHRGPPPGPPPGPPWGVYGLAVEGDDLPASGGAAPGWPALRLDVVVTGRPDPPVRRGLHRHRGSFPFLGGGCVLLRREPLAVTFRLPVAPAPDELLHPYLSVAAAGISYWLGREPFHAGAVVGDEGAWMIAGRSQAGKSTLLAALAAEGAEVFSDDLVVADAGGVFAGPRTVDLRPGTAEHLGLIARTVAARNGTRSRLPLPHPPAQRPLAGWIDLAWGPEVSLRPMDAPERLRRLARRRTFPAKMPVGDTLLEMVALPGFALTRPRRFEALATTVAAVTQLAGRSYDPTWVEPDTVPRSVSAGGR